jgi:UDP-glucose 4-epimerase
VNDVSDACLKAHKHLNDGKVSDIINLGSGQGNSVLEVINEIGVELGKELSYDIRERREGDPSFLVADISYAKARLDWKPKYSLTDIIKTAIKYENRLTKI